MSKKDTDKLAAQVRAGKLKYNSKNLDKVQLAYCEAIKWNQLFKEAHLEFLPDPENTEGYENDFFEWMVNAYVSNGRDEKAVRESLLSVRDQILEMPLS